MIAWITFLVIIGFLLIAIESFVPGMILGIAGGLCLFVALILTYIKFGASYGNLLFVGILVFAAAGLFLWMQFFPKTPTGKILITSETLAESKSSDNFDHLLHKEGKAVSPLRPSGTIVIDQQRIDALAESGFIEQNAIVRIVRIEGSHIFVRKIG